MKLLYITSLSGRRINGFMRSAIYAANEMGIDFTMACNMDMADKEGYEDDCKQYGIKTIHIDFDRNPLSKKNLLAYRQLCAEIHRGGYDAVHCNTPIGGLLGRICAHKEHVPTIIYQAHGFHFWTGAPLKNWLLYYPVERVLARYTDNVACVGPRITDLNGNIVAPFIDRPNRWSQTIGISSARKKRESHKYESGKVYRVYGCCMLLKNKPLHEVDYMDERTFLFYEEDILAERLSKIGAYSYYCANTDIVHLESMTVNKEHGERSKEKTDIALRSMDLYLREYLHYDPISRKACEAVRKLILRLR